MRLVLAANRFPPETVYGYQRAIFFLSQGLSQRGHDVTVITPRRNEDLPAEEEKFGVRVLRFTPRQVPSALWMFGRAMAWRGVKDVMRTIDGKYDALVGLPHYVIGARWWAPSLKTVYRAGGTLLGAKKWERYVWPEEGSACAKVGSYFSWTRQLARERKAIQVADRLVVPSENIKRMLEYYYNVPAQRVHVVPNGADPELFLPVWRKPDGTLRVLATGRLASIKNHSLLVDAVARMSLRDRVEVRIAGEGDLRPQLEKQISERGLINRVKLLGYCRNIEQQYQWADIFVLPSIHEPFGNVLLEAMSSGLPCVGLRSCPPEIWTPCDEWIQHGKTGMLFDTADPSCLAGVLDEFASKPELCEQMGRLGRRRVERELNLQMTAAKYEEVLYDLVRNGAC